MNLPIDQNLFLTDVRENDQQSLITYLNDETIYRNTLTIPYPYTEDHARQWISMNQKIFVENRQHFNLAIRQDDELIGVIGVLGSDPVAPHRREIGYWLGKPFRGQGIMTRAIQVFCQHAFETFDLIKLTAVVFDGNYHSIKALRHTGFKREGFFRSHCWKEGKSIDATAFGLLRSRLS